MTPRTVTFYLSAIMTIVIAVWWWLRGAALGAIRHARLELIIIRAGGRRR